MRIKRIHVNQHRIRENRNVNTGKERLPVISVKEGKVNTYADTVEIIRDGKVIARVLYRPDNPLSCGATCWIETREQIRTSISPPGARIPPDSPHPITEELNL
jgi:hypothetical protein